MSLWPNATRVVLCPIPFVGLLEEISSIVIYVERVGYYLQIHGRQLAILNNRFELLLSTIWEHVTST